MKTVHFYNGIIGNINGDFWEDMLKWSDDRLEVDHDYIQWLFPSNEPSMMNGDAPVLTKEEADYFHEIPELQEKVVKSFFRIIDFLGFKIEHDAVKLKDENIPWWLRGAFNHNCLRVTRIIKSLRLTGCQIWAERFFHELEHELKPHVSQNTWNYWSGARFDPLW